MSKLATVGAIISMLYGGAAVAAPLRDRLVRADIITPARAHRAAERYLGSVEGKRVTHCRAMPFQTAVCTARWLDPTWTLNGQPLLAASPVWIQRHRGHLRCRFSDGFAWERC